MSDYSSIVSALRKIAAGQMPKTDISEILHRHMCTYLLSKIPLSTDLTNKVTIEKFMSRVNVNERFRACEKVFYAFKEMRIPYAVIKGAVLSAAAYGDAFMRCSGDIDILISRKDIDTVKNILKGNGFVQGRICGGKVKEFTRRELVFQSAMSHQTAPFIKKTDGKLCPFVEADVNLDIMWGESSMKADMDFVLSHTEKAELCGVLFQKLSPEMEFISLCLHHYKDFNSIYLIADRGLQLSHLCDILYYLRSCSPSAALLSGMCRTLGVTDYIYYCLYFTNYIFADPTTSEYLDLFDKMKATDLTPFYGLCESERKKWEVPFEERLFDKDFSGKFYQSLSDGAKAKVKTNRDLM